MADNQLSLRTSDLFIVPISCIELERRAGSGDLFEEGTSTDPEEKPVTSGVMARVDPLAGESFFFGGSVSDNSDRTERRYLKSELCADIFRACSDDDDPDFVWYTVWRVSLRANPKELVGLFRFLGPQKKGRVGFELIIYEDYRHLGYGHQLIDKMTVFAFDKSDVYYLYSNIHGNEDPVEYERVLRRSGYKTEEEVLNPFEADRIIPEDEELLKKRALPEYLLKESGVTSYSAAYVMIGLCAGMFISIITGLMLEGLACGLVFSTVWGAIMDHFELKHRRRILGGDGPKKQVEDA
ncbi:MAG: hypothetical protein K6F93_08365 [Lachnospiraceae bacterium]|nr:hypothetical protein [Lachnospiraceae bacterium]